MQCGKCTSKNSIRKTQVTTANSAHPSSNKRWLWSIAMTDQSFLDWRIPWNTSWGIVSLIIYTSHFLTNIILSHSYRNLEHLPELVWHNFQYISPCSVFRHLPFLSKDKMWAARWSSLHDLHRQTLRSVLLWSYYIGEEIKTQSKVICLKLGG